jgi:hypothetical protein
LRPSGHKGDGTPHKTKHRQASGDLNVTHRQILQDIPLGDPESVARQQQINARPR